jgi:hypothetical protein
MKKEELRNKVKDTILKLRKGGYIKGMGTNKYRIMDANHSPIKNLESQVVEVLKIENFIEIDGLVRVLSNRGKTFEFPKNY